MVLRRFEDSSTGGASEEIVILGASATGSAGLGVAVDVDLKMGVREVLETTCMVWVVTTGLSPAFYLPGALGVSIVFLTS
ncbi:UNVERIFIED_CONTAM: hypothetical protein Sradi_2345600 [Sesamum radiatum]|uniref:Uncharacterized protein n=1 Tax=Sesamum radiatum TaxID=300843 RepID=A0AAW2T778_SESRA